MIEIKVFGGLGNQMFQYAFFNYMKIKNENVTLNISDFNIHSHHNGFELERVFGIVEDYNTKPCSYAVNANSVVIRILKKLFKIRISTDKEYFEYSEFSKIPLEQISKDIYFVGFWQDAGYVEHVRKKMLEKFVFSKLTDRKNIDLANILLSNNAVSVHVRRGDYMKNMSLKDICNNKYYEKSLEYMLRNTKNPLFVFFSDDIDWCKKHFITNNVFFVDWNIKENSYIDMQLMSLCKHNIIANSSFSWWGAWLNKNDNKIVIMPDKWTNFYRDNKLICKGWITI